LQVSLAEHGWQFDVLLCHTGADNPFVGTLDGEMAKCGLEAFFDKESLDLGDEVQATIAEAIIDSPFFLVVLNGSFIYQEYPELELKAALYIPTNYKRIIPLFYKMTADECLDWKRKIYRELADCTRWERKMRFDHLFVF
jgi:hypothetical protein